MTDIWNARCNQRERQALLDNKNEEMLYRIGPKKGAESSMMTVDLLLNNMMRCE